MADKKTTRIDKLVLGAIQEIVSTPKRDSASTIDVAQELKLPLREVKRSFLNLAAKGIIDFDDSVQCAKPKLINSQESREQIIDDKAHNYNIVKKISKMLIGALVPAIIAFLIWYFGLSPNSTNLLPFSFGSPINIYNEWFGTSDLNTYWKVEDVNGLIDHFSKNNADPWYTKTFPNAMRVTVTGKLLMSFSVENSAKFSQMNLDSISFRVKKEPIPELIEIYQDPHGLGGGGTRGYDLNIQFDMPESKEREFSANPSSGQNFEFLTFVPGEREMVNVNIRIFDPGFYRITPIAKFSYESRNFEYIFDTLEVIFPRSYHVWLVDNNGHGSFASQAFTVERTDNGYFVDNLVQNPPKENVSFYSTLESLGCRRFTIIGEQVLSSSITESNCGLSTTILPEPLSPDIQSILNENYEATYSTTAYSPNGENIAIVIERDSQSTNGNILKDIIIINQITLGSLDITPPNGRCYSPVWSPSGNYLAFICSYEEDDLTMNDKKELLISDLNGNLATVPLDSTQGFRDLKWSADEQQILIGGDSLWIVTTTLPQSITQIMENFECALCIREPEWEP